jgi:hypothetical protein
LGICVLKQTLKSAETRIELKNLASGVYIAKLWQGSKMFTKQVVVK